MRKLALLVFLVIAGCDSTDLYKQDTNTWFGFPPSTDKKDSQSTPNANPPSPSPQN